MMQIGVENNLQKEMAQINSVIDMLREKRGISVRDHLGFGNAANEQLRFFTDSDGDKCIGERNSDNNLHGKGIAIWSGQIHIGYSNNGYDAPGNYLVILSNGDVSVGEVYLKEGKLWDKFTKYLTNGKTEKYDKCID